MAKIELVDVAHCYVPGEYAVQDINLTWESGVSSALLGPSGCGKTTMLKIISGLLQPSEGQVLLDGEDVTSLSPQERNIAQVFQFPVVYETLNVYDNLAFPLRNRGTDESEVDERVRNTAEILDLHEHLNAHADDLGAAQKQLVSLGRGIIRHDTAAILLDEPLTVIDPHLKWELTRKLKELHKELGFTMIYVTHDQHEALTFAEQVTVMNVGEALQTGNAEALHRHPQAPFVGYFIGSPGMNIFEARYTGDAVQAGEYQLAVRDGMQSQIENKSLKLGIRPEFVKVHAEPPDNERAIECAVLDIHLTGSAQILDLDNSKLEFKARVDEYFDTSAGDTVYVIFPDEHVMLYADDHAIDHSKMKAEATS
jgi:glycerol transport system ATP-binding protein